MEKQNIEKKHFPILPMILCILLLAVLAVYAGGVWYYQSHFLPGTVIDRVDVSGMTLDELEGQIQDYMLCIIERKADGTTLEEDIQGNDISLGYTSLEPFEQILRGQDKWVWFLQHENVYGMGEHLTYSEKELENQLRTLKGFQSDFANAPTDAYISEYDAGTGFVIVPETQGNQLNWSKTLEAVRTAVQKLEDEIDLGEAGCYKTPAVTAEDERLNQVLQKLQKYAGITITYDFGGNKEVLDGATISSWLSVDGYEVTLDQTQVEAYVATLRKRYDSIFRPRTFLTSYGKEITIDAGDYGWWMNYTQEAIELAEMIEKGESGERTPVYYQTAAAYGSPDYGNTYVEINLTAQHLFLYVDGERILESDFVSGNSSRGYDTPVGVYSITYKQRNATLVGENYETPVSYWMPFNRNVGMHDANWRSSFGGDIYKTNGSHGCINLPPSMAQEIYGYIEKGTPVICYQLPGTEPQASNMEKGAPAAEPGVQPENPAENTAWQAQ